MPVTRPGIAPVPVAAAFLRTRPGWPASPPPGPAFAPARVFPALAPQPRTE